MKSFIIVMLLAVGAAAAVAQANQPSASSVSSADSPAQAPQDANAQKARALLEQCMQALGGQAWLSVQDMEQQGRSYSYYQGQPNSLGTLFWRFWKYPDKDRVELTKQRDVVYLNVGDKGYEITYKGTAAQEPEPLADFLREGDFPPGTFHLKSFRLTDASLFDLLGNAAVLLSEPSQVQRAQAPKRLDLSKFETSKKDIYEGGGDGQPQDTRERQKTQPIHVEKKVGRNDPCPCGSGKKYKSCHGIGQE